MLDFKGCYGVKTCSDCRKVAKCFFVQEYESVYCNSCLSMLLLKEKNSKEEDKKEKEKQQKMEEKYEEERLKRVEKYKNQETPLCMRLWRKKTELKTK